MVVFVTYKHQTCVMFKHIDKEIFFVECQLLPVVGYVELIISLTIE